MNPDPVATAFYAMLRDLQFDLEQLQQISDHSLEFEQELLQLYLAGLQAQMTRLHQAASAEDWPQIEQAAHHIKGASANVGAVKLSQLAEALERGAKQQVGRTQTLLKALVWEAKRVHQRIAQALHQDD